MNNTNKGTNCIFCKIIKKEIPSDIVYEDENFIAFLDINPINKGHTLVVPKEHSTNLYDMSDKIAKEIFPLIKKLATAIKKAVGAEGINIGMNNEAAAGQLVMHSHIHIMPRFKGDGLRHWPGKKLEKDEMQALKAKIMQNL
jgi:histidine triad (HIT) family protein